MTNIINAIINIVNDENFKITSHHMDTNRANMAGSALEDYIKDIFSNTLGVNEKDRREIQNKVFSYLGNNSNPPDAMLYGGDAIEIKKIESEGSQLALNSSYPKHTLKINNPMISKACKTAEIWEEKDMLYIVGVVEKKTNILKRLAMVYGRNYCASEEIYERLKNKVKEGVECIPHIEFEQTKELGRINRVDPLGITYMRVRGMWGIENPWKVFHYIYEKPEDASFDLMCIIDKDKWDSFDNVSELISLSQKEENLIISDEKVNNPDNTAKLDEVKLITYRINK